MHGNLYDYKDSEYNGVNNKTKIYCNKCKKQFTQKWNNHIRGHGCQYHNKSKGENKIQHYLDENNIIYEQQYKFNECKNKKCLPFDFYLPDYKLCIEYQGKQHYEIVEFFGGELEFLTRKLNDIKKKIFCLENNIELLYIPHWNFNRMEALLNKLFK